MSRLSERERSERFNDTEGMLRALRRAAEFARLRREMWARFRASVEADEAKPNGAAGRATSPDDGAAGS